MSRKSKNIIDVRSAILLFNDGYGLQTRSFNFYQFRISHEEIDGIFYDWYHTTGSLVKNENGACRSMGVIQDPEDCAIFIKKDLEKKGGYAMKRTEAKRNHKADLHKINCLLNS